MGLRLAVVVAVILGACQSAPRELGSFAIRPVAPSLSAGSGRAAISGSGDLVLAVTLHGPAEEITRTGAEGALQPNLIWHLLEGDCASWERGETTHTVLYRWTVNADRTDTTEFTRVIPKGFANDLVGPHALAAFRNGGGGPLYVCGDLPRAT